MTNFEPISDEFIDRIVDGELTPAELRAAIDRLDREPDAWRRCALAFLEAQCWRESLLTIPESEKLPIHPQPPIIPSIAAPDDQKPRRWLRRAAMAAAVAASFLLGWVGHLWRPTGNEAADGNRTMLAQQPADSPAPLVNPSVPIRTVSAGPHEDQHPSGPSEVIREVARLRIGSENARAEVPILAGPGIDAEWVLNQPPPLSEREEVFLQRQGYQVDQRRRLITKTLADGRRVAFPIDQVRIRYTGNQPL
jgi:hypothetical protein